MNADKADIDFFEINFKIRFLKKALSMGGVADINEDLY